MIDFDVTILYQFANIIVLLILLHFFLFKPVLGALAKRDETLKSLAEGAEGAKAGVRDAEKHYGDLTRESKKPILETKDAAITEARSSATKAIERARFELGEELNRMKGDIEAERKKVSEALKADVGRLSVEVAEKVLKRSLQ